MWTRWWTEVFRQPEPARWFLISVPAIAFFSVLSVVRSGWTGWRPLLVVDAVGLLASLFVAARVDKKP